MLKELFEKTLPTYYKEVNKKEVHIYMSNINKVVDETKERIRKLKTQQHAEGNYEVVHGLHLALCEMAFVTSEIMLEQLNKESQGK